jgi:acetyl esterase/lipase
MDGEIIYNGMSRPQLDDAYDNRGHAPSFAGCLDRWKSASDAVYARRRVLRDLRYGESPRQRLDFFPALIPARPTVFYIHGGYWQWIDKEEESFVAEGPLAHDLNVAILEYTLSPEAGMGEIVAEAAQALDWLTLRLKTFGAAVDQVIVSGSSAGAHLAATLLDHPSVCGALLISGIYDLEPIRLSWLNDLIRMDAQTARTYSPLHQLPTQAIPLCIAFGAEERPEFRRQSRTYHQALADKGLESRLMPVSDTDHFSVMDELASPDGSLTAALLDLCSTIQPNPNALSKSPSTIPPSTQTQPPGNSPTNAQP